MQESNMGQRVTAKHTRSVANMTLVSCDEVKKHDPTKTRMHITFTSRMFWNTHIRNLLTHGNERHQRKQGDRQWVSSLWRSTSSSSSELTSRCDAWNWNNGQYWEAEKSNEKFKKYRVVVVVGKATYFAKMIEANRKHTDCKGMSNQHVQLVRYNNTISQSGTKFVFIGAIWDAGYANIP